MSEPEEQGGSPIEPGMTEDGSGEAPPWVAEFLAGLIVTGSVVQAVQEAGIDFETAWALRRAEPAFAYHWDRAACAHRRIMAGVPFHEAVCDEAASVQ